jgi:glycine betaine/proline transport system ATP-binding protein
VAKQIIIDHVFKVFGEQPERALALVHQGASKQDILAKPHAPSAFRRHVYH